MIGEIIGMTGFWLLLVIALGLAEAATVSLVSIWFACGALVAMICSILGWSVWIQVIAFVVVSTVLLVFTRKIFVDKLKLGDEKTNTDTLIGETALVIKDIVPHEGGRVKVKGVEWKAIFADTSTSAPEATAVGIEAIKKAGADDRVIQLEALKTMGEVANGQATKLIIPSDMQGFAGMAASLKEFIKD